MLKNSKLISETEDNYHIELPSGHKMSLDKKGLHPKAHEIIQKLAEGGEAKNPDKSWSQNDKKDFSKGASQGGGGAITDAVKGALGFDEGGIAQSSAQPQYTPENQFGASEPQQPAMSGDELTQKSPDVPTEGFNPNPIGQAPMPEKGPYDLQEEALKGQGELAKKEGSTEQGLINATQKQVEALPSQEKITNDLNISDAKLQKAYEDKDIDPDRYWHNKSTGSKLAAGLGMLLGGFGAATGQANGAVNMIQNAIERDVDAQKNDQSKAMNLWKMNREKYGSAIAANLATKNQLYTGLEYKLKAAASGFRGQNAQLAAQQGLGKIALEKQQNNALLGLHATLSGRAGDNTEQSVQNAISVASMRAPELAKEAQAKYLPGIGMASIPITPEDRSELTNYHSLSSGIDNAINFQKNVAGTGGAWTPTKLAMAEDIKNGLMLSMGKLNDMKRPPSPEIMKLYSESIGNLGGVNPAGTNLTKLEGLKEQVESRKHSMASDLGVKPFVTSPQIKTDASGIKWQRGPNGEAVRVN